MIASLNASVEQIKTTEDMITPLDSLIQTVKNEKDIPIQFDDELFQKFKTGIDSYVIGANNRTNEAISSENLRNTTTILIFVGYFAFKESFTWNKIAGIFVCVAGLGLINLK